MSDTSSASPKTRMTTSHALRGGQMTARRRGRTSAALWALATLTALLLPVPTPARAADPPTLQVSPEVSTAFGGDAITLTATVSPPGSAPGVAVDFAIEDGPGIATPQNSQCTVPAQATTCQVAIRGVTQGPSIVRASIHGVG